MKSELSGFGVRAGRRQTRPLAVVNGRVGFATPAGIGTPAGLRTPAGLSTPAGFRTRRAVWMRALAALVFSIAAVGSATAGSTAAGSTMTAAAQLPAEQIPVTMTAGETYVIEGLDPRHSPAVQILDNPHALTTASAKPGQLTLLATERGHWIFAVTRADASAASYDVTVNAIEDFRNPLKPGRSPESSIGALGAPPPAGGAAGAGVVASAAGVGDQGAPPTGPDFAAADSVAPDQAIAPLAPASDGSSNQGFRQKFRTDPPATPARFLPRQSDGVVALPPGSISIMAGTSQLFGFSRRVTRVSVADTRVADVEGISPYQINLIGRGPGFSTLVVWDDRGDAQQRQIRCDLDGTQQVLLNVIVAELNRTRIENQGINLSIALSKFGVSLVGLPGSVATSYSPSANLAGTGVAGAGATTTTPPSGIFPSAGQLIPLLLSPNVTYGLVAGNSNIQTQSFFQFLEQHDLARVLAEPRLLASSGQRAKFLSGGEIPIVIAQALNTSIVFKQFGTSVDFIPTVIGDDEIALQVRPEVSEPDFSEGVQLFGFTVPAFVTRSAETVVRLKSSQTLIIAGLLLHNKTTNIQKVPYLGDLPWLGGLFRNTAYTNQETDLVMSVTPELVQPLPEGAQVAVPTTAPLTQEQIRTTRLVQPDAGRPRF